MHKPDKPRKASAKKRAKDVRFTEKADKVQETLKHETPWPEAAKVQETLKREILRPESAKAAKDVRLVARGKEKDCAKPASV